MYLVADIGATNARFQIVQNGELVAAPVVLSTRSYDQSTQLLKVAHAELGGVPLKGALLAIAGPTRGAESIEVTNTGLLITAADAQQQLGCPTQLANDFVALAHGVPYISDVIRVGGAAPTRATKALLGPGTGLGMATLVPEQSSAGEQWRVLASEGGHADLAPGNHLEAELWGVLSAQHEHVCWETVLSGSGLQNLYVAMTALWGGQPDELTPAQIVSQGEDMADPVCHQTLETFCALLGSAAGNLALTVAATGGVYIAGGIVPRLLDFIATSPLRRRFDERGDMTEFVQDIPLLIVTRENPGLYGAACYLKKQLLTT